MHPRLEWTVPGLLAVTLMAGGCGGANPSAVALPEAARALGIAHDFAGTIWEMTGSRPWRSHDGGASWQPVRGSVGGFSVAFTEKGGEVVGPKGAQRGDYGGAVLMAPRATPASFVSVTTPYHRTDRLYALDTSGRLWLSADAGRSWVRLRAARLPATAQAVSAVRGDVVKPDVLYAACGADGLWRSGDDGASFSRVAGAPAVATAVAMTTDDQSRMLVAGGGGLYLSTDFGHSFARVYSGMVSAVAFDPRNRRLAFAAAGRRLLRSVDGGRTWPSP